MKKFNITKPLSNKTCRYIYRHIRRDDILNQYQGKNGKEWETEAQNQLSQKIRKRTKKELAGLDEAVTPRSVIIKRGDILDSIARGLLGKEKFNNDLPVKYLSKAITKNRYTRWQKKSKYPIPKELIGGCPNKTFPLKKIHLIYPEQQVKIEQENGKWIIYVCDKDQKTPGEIAITQQKKEKKQEVISPISDHTQTEDNPPSSKQKNPAHIDSSTPPDLSGILSAIDNTIENTDGIMYATAGRMTAHAERFARKTRNIEQKTEKKAKRAVEKKTPKLVKGNKILRNLPKIGPLSPEVNRQMNQIKKNTGVTIERQEKIFRELKKGEQLLKTDTSGYRTHIEKLANEFGVDFRSVVQEAMKMSQLSPALTFFNTPVSRSVLKGLPVMASLGMWRGMIDKESKLLSFDKNAEGFKTGNMVVDTAQYFVPIWGSYLDFDDMGTAINKGNYWEAGANGLSGTVGLIFDIPLVIAAATGVGIPAAGALQGGKVLTKTALRTSIMAMRNHKIAKEASKLGSAIAKPFNWIGRKLAPIGKVAGKGIETIRTPLTWTEKQVKKAANAITTGTNKNLPFIGKTAKWVGNIPYAGKALKMTGWTLKETVSSMYNVLTLKMFAGNPGKDILKASRTMDDEPTGIYTKKGKPNYEQFAMKSSDFYFSTKGIMENNRLDKARVGESIFNKDFYKDPKKLPSMVQKSDKINICFDHPIGDSVLMSRNVNLMRKYLNQNGMRNKKITIYVADPHINFTKKFNFGSNIEIKPASSVESDKSSFTENTLTINYNKEDTFGRLYRVSGKTAIKNVPGNLISFNYASFGNQKGYDSLGERVVRGFERMLGQKIVESPTKFLQEMQKSSNYNFDTFSSVKTRHIFMKDLKEKEYIVIQPDTGASFKNYSPKKWGEVVNKMLKKYPNQKIVVLHKPDNSNLMEKEITNLNKKYPRKIVSGRVDLKDIPETLYNAKLVLAGDTGLAHIAGIVNTPTIMLNAVSNPKFWHTTNPDHVVLSGGNGKYANLLAKKNIRQSQEMWHENNPHFKDLHKKYGVDTISGSEIMKEVDLVLNR